MEITVLVRTHTKKERNAIKDFKKCIEYHIFATTSSRSIKQRAAKFIVLYYVGTQYFKLLHLFPHHFFLLHRYRFSLLPTPFPAPEQEKKGTQNSQKPFLICKVTFSARFLSFFLRRRHDSPISGRKEGRQDSLFSSSSFQSCLVFLAMSMAVYTKTNCSCRSYSSFIFRITSNLTNDPNGLKSEQVGMLSYVFF